MADVKQELRSYIEDNFVISATRPLGNADSLLDSGAVDSTGFIELISFLEDHFRIQVADEEMIPENLDSIDNLAGYIARKRGG
jgi:acyl carrier protein